jgi:2-methylisocitrate lyase-like PEP mutase family enzyme
MKKTTTFRNLLAKEGMIVAPAAYDCLSAVIIEKIGFDVIFMSGFSLSASVLGNPDIGTETRTETVSLTRHMAASVDLPVFVDASNGYGGPLSVYQTVKELERAGAAGCFIEDQTFPPKCPFISTQDVISEEEFLLKLRAAMEAREDEDFVIIARTDAAATLGVKEALKRGKAYRDAGADLILPCAGVPRDKKGLKQFIDALGAPVMVLPAWELGLTVKDYEDMGVKILAGIEAIFAAAKAVEDIYLELKTTGSVKEAYCQTDAIPEFAKLLKLEKWIDLEKKF